MTTKNAGKIGKRQMQVLEKKLENPEKSQREIAAELNIGNGTVHRDLKSLEQDGALNEIKAIDIIKDADLEIVTLGQSILLDRMKDEEERKKINARDISAITETSHKRRAFLAGENSNDQGGEVQRPLADISTEQLLMIANGKAIE